MWGEEEEWEMQRLIRHLRFCLPLPSPLSLYILDPSKHVLSNINTATFSFQPDSCPPSCSLEKANALTSNVSSAAGSLNP